GGASAAGVTGRALSGQPVPAGVPGWAHSGPVGRVPVRADARWGSGRAADDVRRRARSAARQAVSVGVRTGWTAPAPSVR
ncbi:hypothetical protein NGM37_20935, partial [Streptomyces sp. TRM76130]|nr:hypothetical protein [Streptomyces sp. TRM76130]